MTKKVMTISEEAAQWIQEKFASEHVGLLVSVNKKGCAGGEYEFKPLTQEEVTLDYGQVEDQGVTLFYPRTLLLSLIGSELVLYKDQFATRLDFNNPNEQSRCGCGESIQLF